MNSIHQIQKRLQPKEHPGPGLPIEKSKSSSIYGNKRDGHSFFFQPKLTVNTPGDEYEKEADEMADKVMRMQTPFIQTKPLPITPVQRKCDCEEEDKKTQRKEINSGKTTVDHTLENYVGNLNGDGQPLSNEVRNFYEPRFGYDFGKVKVHTDSVAAKSAQSINAVAYTSGSNIVFNEGKFAPRTESGQKLLAHELSHVVQQHAGTKKIQRQFELGTEPRVSTSVDLNSLSDVALQERYERLQKQLEAFTSCTPEQAALISESYQIEAILNVRHGITFSPESIDKLKTYHTRNAAKAKKKKQHDSCIIALNKGASLLQDKTAEELKTTSHTIEETMAGMEKAGYISGSAEINFFDRKGRPTKGSSFPAKLQASVWDTVLSLAAGNTGWIVFGLSLMDGNHSVTLTLDNNNPSNPRIYWSDQWGSKGGWKEYTKSGLDKEVTSLIQEWWNEQPPERKFNTVVRLWRLKPAK